MTGAMDGWWVYYGGPVDDFSAFTPWETYAERFCDQWAEPDIGECIALSRAREMMALAQDLDNAMAAARLAGWGGDIRCGEGGRNGPYVVPILDNMDEPGVPPAVAYTWKQDNNGTTYIVSPSPLQSSVWCLVRFVSNEERRIAYENRGHQ